MKKLIILLLLTAVFTQAANSKDLFVSPSGDDATTYANNDINNPWLTIEKAWLNSLAGDTVFYRAGTYTVTTEIDGSLGNSGSLGNRITHTVYNGELVTWESGAGNTRDIAVETDYITVDGIVINSASRFFHIGYNTNGLNFEVKNCTLTTLNEGGGVNMAPITLQSPIRSTGTRIENCIFYGNVSFENPNTAGFFSFQAEDFQIKNCEFYNLPSAIFYKHTGAGINSGTVIENCYFDSSASIYDNDGIRSSGQYLTIKNNIFNGCDLRIQGDAGGSGGSGENHGGDYNTVYNNTFFNGKLLVEYQSEGDGSGASNNNSYNNLISPENYEVWRYGVGLGSNTSDYNLYNNTSAAIYNESVNYSLSGWQIFSFLDSNSISGVPTFTGGTTPTTIEGFGLTSESIGYQGGSDGKDIGANVTLVGVEGEQGTTVAIGVTGTVITMNPTGIPVTISN